MILKKIILSALIVFFGLTSNVKAQDDFLYYTSLLNNQSVSILQLEHKVDSLVTRYLSNSEYKKTIKIAHHFSIQLFNKKIYDKAIQYAQKEISIYRKLKIKDKKYTNALNNLALFYSLDKDVEKSVPIYKEIISLHFNDKYTALAYCELGNYYGTKGDYFRSKDFYTQGIFILKKLGKKKLLVKKYLDYAIVLKKIDTEKSLEKEKEILDKAAELFKEIPSYSPRDYRSLNNSYANYYKKKLQFADAENYYVKNLEDALTRNDSTTICISYTNLADLYLNPKNRVAKDSVSYFLNEGLKYSLEKIDSSVIHHQFSKLYLYKKQYTKALAHIQNALKTSIILTSDVNILPKPEDLTAVDNKFYVLLDLIQKATILIKLYKKENNPKYLESALQNLISADTLVDILLEDSTEQKSKLYWRKEATEIYVKGVLCSELLKKPQLAFYFSEKNKALVLTEGILRNADHIKLPYQIVQKENILKKEILVLNHLISKEQNNTTTTRLKNKRFSLKQAYQKYKDSLNTVYSGYYTHQEKTKVLPLEEVQKTLNPKNVVISYLGATDTNDTQFSKLYGIAISSTDSQVFEIGNLQEIEQLITNYRKYISKPFETEDERIGFQKIAFQLYKLLLPVDTIKIPIANKHLIIIPDGKLQYLPFESLITNKNPNRYLIEDNEISYAYSMSFLLHNKNINRNASNDLVGFAPISFLHNNLEDINNSYVEMECIESTIPGKQYRLSDASKSNFLANTKDHKIIHLATHADASGNPWIAFHDSNLQYHELYTTKNQAELVVLSACNTSLGTIARGEGVLSLARGFFFSGANTVISTFWNANDKSTAAIMSNLYSNLKNGETKSRALHNAKIQYLNDSSLSDVSPYYWATFVLIGDADTVLFPTNTTTSIIIGVFFLLLLLISGLLYNSPYAH